MTHELTREITQAEIDDYRDLGVVRLEGVLSQDWINLLAEALEETDLDYGKYNTEQQNMARSLAYIFSQILEEDPLETVVNCSDHDDFLMWKVLKKRYKPSLPATKRGELRKILNLRGLEGDAMARIQGWKKESKTMKTEAA